MTSLPFLIIPQIPPLMGYLPAGIQTVIRPVIENYIHLVKMKPLLDTFSTKLCVSHQSNKILNGF